jgi:hypothetical protein
MNGRVYDPILGRFLSPDPSVQFVADFQSYNRYTYATNNPLKYVDPTGYSIWSSLGSGLMIGGGIALGGLYLISGGGAILITDAMSIAQAVAPAGAALESAVSIGGLGIFAGKLGVWHGIPRLAKEIGVDTWQSAKTAGSAGWGFVRSSGLAAWDTLVAGELLVRGEPRDALKKLAAGYGNLGISYIYAYLTYASIYGGYRNPLGDVSWLDFSPMLQAQLGSSWFSLVSHPTAVGIGLGVFGCGCVPEIHWHNGGFVYEFPNSLTAYGSFGEQGLTLGRAVLFEGTTDRGDTQTHEWQHVTQYGLLGGLYIPVEGLSLAVSNWLSDENNDQYDTRPPRHYNPLEWGPYDYHPWPTMPVIPW